MKTSCSLTAAMAVFAITAHSAHAGLIILGNLPAANDGLSATISTGTPGSGFVHDQKAVSFTMPPQSYPVDRVALRLREYNTAAGDVAAVGFYADNGSDLPGALVGSLLVSPQSESNALGQFDFTPASPLTLAASTKYWLVVDATAGAFYQWQGSSPSITPTSQVGASFGKEIAIVRGEPRAFEGVTSFEIVSTIPEPGTSLLIFCALCGVAAARRYR